MSTDSNNKMYRKFGPTNLAVDNAISIFILSGIIFLFGIQSYNTMPKELFPEIVIPTIYVGTTYAGNSAEDMEELVTIPLEKEIASINGIKKIDGTSIQDFSNIIVEFNTNIEVDKALREVKDAVDKAKSKQDFPKDLTAGPNVFEINFSEFPIMTVNISGRYTEDELRGYSEYLQDEIEKLPEISEVKLKGTSKREVKIDVDWFKMQSRTVSFNDIANAVGQENLTMSAGDFKANGFNRSVRIVGELKSVDDIKNIIVKSEFQNPIFIKDIAEVYESFADPTSIARSNGMQVISLDVVKRSGQNLLAASDQIKEIVEKAKAKKFPTDLSVRIFNDQSIDTRDQVANLQNSIISGVILVILVLLFFMGFRNSLFVGLAIPMSMLMGILILNLMGITLNMIVLFSLILALGLLVDNSIVVVENIYRHMQEGYSPIEAAKVATGEVAMPIISSTATTLAAFFPLLFWPGIMGEFMGYLPLTLIIVLASSLFVALVLTPVFTTVFMKIDDELLEKQEQRRKNINNLVFVGVVVIAALVAHISGTQWARNLFGIVAIITLINYWVFRPASNVFQNKFLPALENVYNRFISFSLKGIMPYVMLLGTFGLLVLSFMLMGIFPPKVIFFPDGDPKYINTFVDLPIGSDIESTNKIMRELEAKIDKAIEPYKDKGIVEAVLSQIGENTSDPAGPPEPGATPNKARLTVSFVPADKRKGISTLDVMEDIRKAIHGYAGIEIVVDRNQEGPPTGKPINLEISGDEVEMRDLSVVAAKVLSYLKAANIQGVEELKMNISPNVQQDLITIDREAARRYGLSTYDIAMTLRTSLYGREVSKLKKGDDEYPIMLRFAEPYRSNQEALMNQMVTFRNMDAGGAIVQVPIASVATKTASSTYNSIKRKNEKRTITIYSNVLEDYNPNEVVGKLQDLMSNYQLPEGYTAKFTGEQEEQEAAMSFLSTAFFIAVMAIFLIIVSQFNSLMSPFIIILSVLFSTIGVLLGYVFTGMDLVIIMTGIGIISLAGVVVNNAIVLIDYTNFLQERAIKDKGGEALTDEEIRDSIIQGGMVRLRPVLLTAITTVLGLIPLATGFNFDFVGLINNLAPNIYWGGDNAAMWGAMSWTVVYGLTFATIVTLVIVPVMYWLAYKFNKRVRRLLGYAE